MTHPLEDRIRRIERNREAAPDALASLIRGELRGELGAVVAECERADRRITERMVERAQAIAVRIRADLIEMDRVTDGTAWKQRERSGSLPVP